MPTGAELHALKVEQRHQEQLVSPKNREKKKIEIVFKRRKLQ